VEGQVRNTLLTTFLALFLVACASTPGPEDWPSDAPSFRFFRQAYQSDAANRARQSEAEYLGWVRRFYEGHRVFPRWSEITTGIADKLEPQEQARVDDIGFRLGRRIAAEWAKDNAVRRIDTGMLSLWGSVIIAGDTPEEQLDALLAIDRDTRALLNGELSADDINEDRYPGLDSFF
jgi:hypothetical protein